MWSRSFPKPAAKARRGGGYIPRFRNLTKGEKRGFIRGYAFDFNIGGTPDPKYFGTWGEELQKELEQSTGRGFSATAMGEVLPRYENHVTINKNVKDAWGIPVLNFQCKYSENEFNMAKDAVDTLAEVCHNTRLGSAEQE